MKIEPGCLAIIKNRLPEDNGKVVKVGNFLGQVPDPESFFPYLVGKRWEIDQQVQGFKEKSKRPNGYFYNNVREEDLLRIDGYKEPAHEKEKRVNKGIPKINNS